MPGAGYFGSSFLLAVLSEELLIEIGSGTDLPDREAALAEELRGAPEKLPGPFGLFPENAAQVEGQPGVSGMGSEERLQLQESTVPLPRIFSRFPETTCRLLGLRRVLEPQGAVRGGRCNRRDGERDCGQDYCEERYQEIKRAGVGLRPPSCF